MMEAKKSGGRSENTDFFTMDQASGYLGVSKNTLYKYTSNNVIPYFKVRNRKIYFKKSDLDAFVFNDSNRISSQDEIEARAVDKLLEKGN